MGWLGDGTHSIWRQRVNFTIVDTWNIFGGSLFGLWRCFKTIMWRLYVMPEVWTTTGSVSHSTWLEASIQWSAMTLLVCWGYPSLVQRFVLPGISPNKVAKKPNRRINCLLELLISKYPSNSISFTEASLKDIGLNVVIAILMAVLMLSVHDLWIMTLWHFKCPFTF